jgi:hypothetical protein
MFIPDPDFYLSRILDPKTETKERGEKIGCYTFFIATNFTKLNFFFEMLMKKIWPVFTELLNLLTKNLSPSSQKYGFGIRDPGSGIRKNLFPIVDLGPGVKKAADPGSATLHE